MDDGDIVSIADSEINDEDNGSHTVSMDVKDISNDYNDNVVQTPNDQTKDSVVDFEEHFIEQLSEPSTISKQVDALQYNNDIADSVKTNVIDQLHDEFTDTQQVDIVTSDVVTNNNQVVDFCNADVSDSEYECDYESETETYIDKNTFVNNIQYNNTVQTGLSADERNEHEDISYISSSDDASLSIASGKVERKNTTMSEKELIHAMHGVSLMQQEYF